MASEKQIVANKVNALKSTGPRSLAGKARSSQNAVKHGLTSMHAMLPGEDPEEFRGLQGAMMSSLKAQGALENQLVERAASLIWRMRRVPVMEKALFEWAAYFQTVAYDREDDPIEISEEKGRNSLPGSEPEINDELRDPLTLGRMFEAVLSTGLTSKLTRYESGMQRQLSQTLKELREMQAARLDVSNLVNELVDERLAQIDREEEERNMAPSDRFGYG